MRAALLYKARDIRMETIPEPQPREGEALVRIGAVGICGSDLHFYHDGRIGDAVVEKPHILGHEYAGVVVDANKVPGIKDGDVVAVEPGIPCWNCESCVSGRYNLCADMHFTGSPPYHGAYCELMALPHRNLWKLDPNVSMAEAAMIEPLAVALHTVNMARVRPADHVAIIGLGSIGLFTMAAARLAGATKFYGTDIVPERLEFARRYGFTEVFDASKGSPVEAIMEATKGRGADVAFECVGGADTFQNCIDVTRRGGMVAYVGISLVPVTVDFSLARRKELTIQNIRRYVNNYGQCIELLASGAIDAKPIVTHRFKLDQVKEAFDFVDEKRDGVIKAVIENT